MFIPHSVPRYMLSKYLRTRVAPSPETSCSTKGFQNMDNAENYCFIIYQKFLKSFEKLYSI
jgi:hypothetical protein